MTLAAVALVALGAAVGAPVRFLVDRAVQARHDSGFPWGTMAVNVAGSLLLGVLAGGLAAGALSAGVGTLIGVGFCGTLTTYSTFGYETVRLFEDGSRFYAISNAAMTLFAGLGAAFFGWAIAQALWR
ncbi:MAG: fluoride efflux transporter CrcB [Carbonactinosporaceae bacterium]